MPERNIRLFIAFRTLFNGRFYYPVFAILFLDYGLTFEQFAILNAVWAATSILLEVPSGAMADVLGRKRLLVLAGVFMVLEMALIAFVPLGNVQLVFWAFLLNRVLSGIAESLASGADEALAYDSLPDTPERETRWAGVLESTMRVQSAFFVIATLLGAAVYDDRFLNRVLGAVGIAGTIPHEVAIRLPLYLTLVTAVAVVVITLFFHESRPPAPVGERPSLPQLWKLAFRQTLATGRWTLGSKPVMAILLAGVFLDSVIRLFLTINSQYYRLIGLPEASFGVVGTFMAAMGIFTPILARKMQLRLGPGTNFLITGASTLLALAGCALALRLYGVVFAVFIMVSMTLTQFFMSSNLNRLARPEQRATLLSFRGLLINFAYGLSTLAFGACMVALQERARVAEATAPGSPTPITIENQALQWFLAGFPVYFVVAGGLVALTFLWLRKGAAAEPAAAQPAA